MSNAVVSSVLEEVAPISSDNGNGNNLLHSPPEAAKKSKKKTSGSPKPKNPKKRKSVICEAATEKESRCDGNGSKTSDGYSDILDYMRSQNRPYNIQIVYDNLQRKYKKPEVERSLDKLAADKKLIVKDLGKTKVYMYEQSQFDTGEANQVLETAAIKDIRADIERLESDIKIDSEKLQRRRNDAKKIESIEVMENQIKSITRELDEKKNKGQKKISKEKSEAIKLIHSSVHFQWANKKKLFSDVIKKIAESANEEQEDLMYYFGTEMDEQHIPPDAYQSYT